jgi:hypothetical protein
VAESAPIRGRSRERERIHKATISAPRDSRRDHHNIWVAGGVTEMQTSCWRSANCCIVVTESENRLFRGRICSHEKNIARPKASLTMGRSLVANNAENNLRWHPAMTRAREFHATSLHHRCPLSCTWRNIRQVHGLLLWHSVRTASLFTKGDWWPVVIPTSIHHHPVSARAPQERTEDRHVPEYDSMKKGPSTAYCSAAGSLSASNTV